MNNNPLQKMFEGMRQKGRKAIIPFLTAGYPNPSLFFKILHEIAKVSDAVEIGVPFSDPLADGKTIQHASETALKEGMTLLRLMKGLKDHLPQMDLPVLIMTYFNPIFQFPLDNFLGQCKELGISGLIVPDLPFEESDILLSMLRDSEISLIQFITPTTKKDRLARISESAEGFLYIISLTGTTGQRKTLPEQTNDYLKSVRALTDKPICLGFGISGPDQVKKYKNSVDGFIVGSALLDCIDSGGDPSTFINHLRRGAEQ
jgi:tryptophan synthase alpha chain